MLVARKISVLGRAGTSTSSRASFSSIYMPGHHTFLKTVPYAPPPWAAALTNPPTERVVLGNFPTPIFPFRPPGLPEGVQMFIKRDDYSGLEMSGNKARKLEFLLAEALREGADCVVTCGGVQSNHCRATAVSARMLGLDSYLLLRTSDTESDPGLIGNLLIDRLVGSELILVPRLEYAKQGGGDYFIEKTVEKLRLQGRKPYGIPVGGSNGLGTWGYLESIEEMEHQFKDLNITVTDVAFACGSGGSAAGLGVGAYLYAQTHQDSSLQFNRLASPPVHAYIVCDSPKYFYDHVDNKILPEMGFKVAAADRSFSAKDCLQMTDAQGAGYATSTKDELVYISQVARETGVLLDPVYSGKALYMLVKDLQDHPDKFAGKSILFIHTGGMFGLYDKVGDLIDDVVATNDVSVFTA
ncbi:hypothetical protein H310_11927 [Aphanomyces invadans]|uniref:Tryptophan synthase beta chain-like PALP domain-containing protein n=1 Tax=Aphanomyces invadans TaxID=157072 RepID=A0A024TLM0_9STRA|nr:hypothetical protein H310_11927 [Aphanomyces invadans]ETV94252.1 hypothetical protein H310_11927 [Aphanomyces invadans]|eukprot:XP_008877014.1 hypothetical protein H310_11927 [Aphanomyces invadans]